MEVTIDLDCNALQNAKKSVPKRLQLFNELLLMYAYVLRFRYYDHRRQAVNKEQKTITGTKKVD